MLKTNKQFSSSLNSNSSNSNIKIKADRGKDHESNAVDRTTISRLREIANDKKTMDLRKWDQKICPKI